MLLRTQEVSGGSSSWECSEDDDDLEPEQQEEPQEPEEPEESEQRAEEAGEEGQEPARRCPRACRQLVFPLPGTEAGCWTRRDRSRRVLMRRGGCGIQTLKKAQRVCGIDTQ